MELTLHDIILITGSITFGFTSAFFFAENLIRDSFSRKDFNFPFFVSLITLISYLIMLEGSILGTANQAEGLYWTRWVFYAFSCSLLIFTIAKQLDFNSSTRMRLIYLTVIVMITGALAAIFPDVYKWIMFGISSIAYVLLIYPILTSRRGDAGRIKLFILAGWSVFPLIFFLSPAGIDAISVELATGIYLILDILTKVIFYLMIEE